MKWLRSRSELGIIYSISKILKDHATGGYLGLEVVDLIPFQTHILFA